FERLNDENDTRTTHENRRLGRAIRGFPEDSGATLIRLLSPLLLPFRHSGPGEMIARLDSSGAGTRGVAGVLYQILLARNASSRARAAASPESSPMAWSAATR